jgi:hypothetical protein
MAGWLLADPTNIGLHAMPRWPPVPMFGAQNTGSPTHLMSHTYEPTLRWVVGRTLARIAPM